MRSRLGIQTCWIFPQILHNNLHVSFPSLIIIAKTCNGLLFGTRVNFPVSKINFQNSKRQFDPSCYSSTNCPGHRRGGPPIVSSKVRILALQLSTWPSAYDATPCHEWRSTWGPCFSETFCTSFQHSQELSSKCFHSTYPYPSFWFVQSCCASWL